MYFSGNRIGMHSINPVVTPGKVDFQSFSVIGDTAKYPLVKIHGNSNHLSKNTTPHQTKYSYK